MSNVISMLIDSHYNNGYGPEFLEWISDRLVNVYGESEHTDFVQALRSRAERARSAIEFAKNDLA